MPKHADKTGSITNPGRWWQEAGYKNANTASVLVSYLVKKGVLTRIGFGKFKVKGCGEGIPTKPLLASCYEKLYQLICEKIEKSKNGIIKNPAKFWKKAGYKNRDAAHMGVHTLVKKGRLERIGKAIYKLVAETSDGTPKKDSGETVLSTSPTAAQTQVLPETATEYFVVTETEAVSLTEKQKGWFDLLNNIPERKIYKEPGAIVVIETDLEASDEDEEEKEDFLKKMLDLRILQNRSQGTKGRTFNLNIEKYTACLSQIKKIPNLNYLILKAQQEMKEEEQKRKNLNQLTENLLQEMEKRKKREKELQESIERSKKQLDALYEEIETLHQKGKEIEEEAKKTKPLEEIERMKKEIEVLKIFSSLKPKEWLSFFEKISPK